MMKSFRSYLMESVQIPPITDTKAYAEWLQSNLIELGGWFNGAWFGATPKDAIYSKLQTLISSFQNANSWILSMGHTPAVSPSKLYRSFPVDHLRDNFVSDEYKKELDFFLDSPKSSPERALSIMQILNYEFKNKTLALDTGLLPVQSWTESFLAAEQFYMDYKNVQFRGQKHSIFTIVESNFTSPGILFYYKNLKTIQSLLSSYVTKIKGHAAALSLYRLSEQLEDLVDSYYKEQETVVDTTIPRLVTVKQVYFNNPK